jgi:hypothetical protein
MKHDQKPQVRHKKPPSLPMLANLETKARISDGLKEFRRSFAWASGNLGVSTTALSRWLNGETDSPRIERQVPDLLRMIKELRRAKGAFLPPKKKPRRGKRAKTMMAEPEAGGN